MIKYRFSNEVHHIVFEENEEFKLGYINDFIRLFSKINKDCNHKVKIIIPRLYVGSRKIFAMLFLAGIIEFYKREKNFDIEVIEDKNNISVNELYSVSDIETRGSIFNKIIHFNDEEIEGLHDILYNTIKYEYKCGKDFLPSLSWCIKEVLDNISVHSGVSNGLFLTSFNKKNNRLTIAVYDQGKGIKASFLDSPEFSIMKDIDAVSIVTEKGVSGDKQGQGMGLYGLKQILLQAKGFLFIASGKIVLREMYGGNETIKKEEKQTAVVSTDHPGTCISFSLDIKSNINLTSVFGEYHLYEKINREIDEMLNEDDYIVFKVVEKAVGGTSTRKSGRDLRNYLLNVSQTGNQKILLDFEKIETISSSFADEMVAKLLQFMKLEKFEDRFKRINENTFVKNVIEAAIEKRKN